MPLTKKIISLTVVAILLSVTFLVLVYQFLLPLIFGTHFTLTEPCSVHDDNGFPSLSFSFSCTGTVTAKIFGPDSRLIDSDFFFKGDHDATLRLGEYRHTIKPGQYKLMVYDKDNKEVYSETIPLDGSNLSILSCDQEWWKRDASGDYSFFGLKLNVRNTGDTPVYPYDVRVTIDSGILSNLVLPYAIAPYGNGYAECFIYRQSIPNNHTFSAKLRDIDGNVLATGSFSIDVKNIVTTSQFTLKYGEYGNIKRELYIPKSDYLYDYYTSLQRTLIEDYSLYITDPYDDQYISVITDYIMSGIDFNSDAEKVNYVASLAQILEYRPDSETNSSYEYPSYPIETLFDNNIGRDCEDKAILTANILNDLGYDVALLRFPGHMAVGVNLSKSAIPQYNYYVDNYYFLETTTEGKPCGFVPQDFRDSVSNVTVYPIKPKPLLVHDWENNILTIFTNTDRGDLVKVTVIVENLGSTTAKNIIVEGAFFTSDGVKLNYGNETISSLEPYMKKEVTISVNIPKGSTTWFKTRIYLDGVVVDKKESASSFP